MAEVRVTVLKPSRREAIATLAGFPALTALLSACTNGKAPSLEFDGTVIGADAGAGHFIRSGDLRERPAKRTESAGVAILGAGISGLTAAWSLSRAGFNDYVIFDVEPASGGNARFGQNTVSKFPWGAHYVPVPVEPNPPLEALLEEAGAIEGRTGEGRPVWSEHALVREPEERLYFRGFWHEGLFPRIGASKNDLLELSRFEAEMMRMASLRGSDGKRAFAIPTLRSSSDAEFTALDKLSMREWLEKQGFTSERLFWFAEYGCRDDFGADLTQTSAWAGIHYFAARMSGTANQEPAPFLTWPHGNGKIVEVLERTCGRRIQAQHLVFDVADSVPGQPISVRVLDLKKNEVVDVTAQAVIFALPKYTAPYILEAYRENRPDFFREFEYSPWFVANITIKERPVDRGFPMAWDNVLYDSRGLGYVVATHQMGVDQGPTVWTYYYAFAGQDRRPARQTLLDASWKDLALSAVGDLSQAHPRLAQLISRIDVCKWGHAMAVPRPGFIWGSARKKAAEPLGEIHFAHADVSGLPLIEDAIDSGLRAAKEVLDSGITR